LLDRYMIVKRVGGGGMGSVYMARDKRLADRPCAVKEMIELFADDNQKSKAVDDFKREAEVLAQLEHPSIPTIYDYFIESGRYYLVMKWIGGGDLAEQMRTFGGRVEERVVTKWAIQICDVLNYIHSQVPPIIYRDLKPANLMLDDKTGRVMLVDFGIARTVRPTEKGVTAIGTMGYAPPELFSGKVEPRSDIYSLGATMFHMMTGTDPQDNPLLIFDFTKNPRPAQLNSAISAEMEHILIKAVAHKPEDRPASAVELKRMLEEHYSRQPGGPPSSQRPIPATYAPRPDAAAPVPAGSPASVSRQAIGQAVGQPAAEPAADLVFCGRCGEKIATDDQFCPHCGTRQPVGGAAASSPPKGGAQGQRITAQLYVMSRNNVPLPFKIDKDSVLIGRTDPHTSIFPEIDLTMHDPDTKVSRKHARIIRKGEEYFVEDLQSVNGTIVKSAGGGSIRLNPKMPRKLANGDELKLGETTLKFVIA
jgi:serine/threonine-protein kinase